MTFTAWKLSHALALASLVALGYSQPITNAKRTNNIIRLMPLGDSITWGYQSSDGNGFRASLYNSLVQGGHTVDFVGAQQSGNMADSDNEGWPGYKIDDISAKATADVPSRLPNIYTVDMGANDCNESYEMDTAASRIESAIDNLLSMTPTATIVLSTLTENGAGGDLENNVITLNAQIRTLVQQKQGAGVKIVITELHDGANALSHANGDFADDLHPNDQGYQKMAALWLESINYADGLGYIVDPQ